LEIRELLWRDANVAKLAAHGITQEEVRQIAAVDRWVSLVHPRCPDQVRVTGLTRGGRLLTIALEATEDPALWRPVTGWDANSSERAYYIEQTRWMR
jgi:hypothetical protein